jgi:glycine cleavage system aminomethyltransferase T
MGFVCTEMTSTTQSPLEAGLGWITKFTKDFTNAENLKKEREKKTGC